MPLDLLDSNDPLVRQLPASFLQSFDPHKARSHLPAWYRPGRHYTPGRLAVAEWIRQGWHSLFADCRVLNDARYTAISNALAAAITPLEIAWAIRAYADHCRTEKFRIDNRHARRTFESFFANALEYWIPHGQALRDKQRDRAQRSAERVVERRQQQTVDGLHAAWDAMTGDARHELIQQAVKRLAARNIYPGREDMANPMVRTKVFEILQEDLRSRNTDARPVGQVVGELV